MQRLELRRDWHATAIQPPCNFCATFVQLPFNARKSRGGRNAVESEWHSVERMLPPRPNIHIIQSTPIHK